MREKPDPQKNEDAEQNRGEEVFPGHYFDFFDLLDVKVFQQRTLVLNSRISEYTAGKLTRAFEALSTSGDPSKPVTLLISSDGGDFYAGLTIVRAIQAAQARGCSVVGEVRGYAMSMAAIILQFCDLRFAAPEDILMLHGATVSIGDTDIRGQKSELDLIEKKSGELSRFLAERNTADVPLAYWEGLFRDNHPHYFSGQEALEKGLIDKVL